MLSEAECALKAVSRQIGIGRVADVSGRLSKIGVGDPLDFGAENSVCSPLADDTVGSRRANYGVDLSLRRHAFLSPDNTLSLTLFSERRSEYKVYVREDIGAEVSVRRETINRLPITLAYRISYGQTQANAVSLCQFFNACVAADVAQLRERRVLTTLTATAVRDRTNSPLNPTRGTVLSLETAVSSKYLGSSSLHSPLHAVTSMLNSHRPDPSSGSAPTPSISQSAATMPPVAR